jgi:hypothetical protein
VPKKPSHIQQDLFDDTLAAQATTTCMRCRQPIRLAPRQREESYPFRLAVINEGVCANCVVTEFLYNTYPINEQLDRAGPEILLHPLMSKAFQPIVAQCDMNVEEIDWQLVVANWHLPVEVRLTATNPYRMGDMRKRALTVDNLRIEDSRLRP